MSLKLAAAALLASSATAFSPSTPAVASRTAVLRSSFEEKPPPSSEFGYQTALYDSPRIVPQADAASKPDAPKYRTLNGWTPDEDAFCWGLPGTTLPMGTFDPAGLSKDLDLAEMKRYREAEVTHGRVGMLAAVGFLVSESFHPLFGGQISGPAIYHLTEVRKIQPETFEIIGGCIAVAELYRSLIGWKSPNEVEKYFGGELKADYYPGDLGFDPLGLKPTNAAGFKDMQNKELNHGRIAMLAAMAFIVQERINDLPIMTDLFGWQE